jgi:radical SAM superfamily enzyme YgiQ (UPF0313 family)
VSSSILLINTNTCTDPYPVYPLGVAHLNAILSREGFSVHILDRNFDSENPVDAIHRIRPDYVGISLRNIDDTRVDDLHYYVPQFVRMVREIKEHCAICVILGGCGFSLFPQQIVSETGADFGIVGEGEESMVLLVHALDKKEPWDRIPGLVYRDGPVVKSTLQRSIAAEKIPRPLRPPSLTKRYLEESTMLNIQTQRGCAHRCCYCSYPVIEGREFRPRKAEDVGEELEQIAQLGARYVFIVDSVFNSSNDHVQAICEEIIRRNVEIGWGCFLRPAGITDSLMETMVRAGLKHIEFGTDSFCDQVLEAYGKNFSFSDIVHASECARKAKVRYAHFLIIGGPGESEQTIWEGFNNSHRLRRTVIFPYIGMRLFPHTPLYSVALEEKRIERETDLMQPYFYLSPLVTRERISELLELFHERKSNWIIHDLTPDQLRIMKGLRTKGVVGPMWEFLAQ